MPIVYADKYEKKIAEFRRWHKGKRAKEDVTQEDLAKALGVSQPSISAKLRVKGKGQTEITYRELLILLKAVHATPEEIVEIMSV